MRKSASGLSDVELLERYRQICGDILQILMFGEVPIYDTKTVKRYNKERKVDYIKDYRKRTYEEIPVKLQDGYAGTYAEILHRMGKSESEIGECLKNDMILGYKNGEEQYFINQS